eukprot:222483-Hanusia_phi.AAC.1
MTDRTRRDCTVASPISLPVSFQFTESLSQTRGTAAGNSGKIERRDSEGLARGTEVTAARSGRPRGTGRALRLTAAGPPGPCHAGTGPGPGPPGPHRHTTLSY